VIGASIADGPAGAGEVVTSLAGIASVPALLVAIFFLLRRRGGLLVVAS